MDMEDDLSFSDDAFTVSPGARQDLELMRQLLRALEKSLDPAAGGGDPFPCSAWSMTFRQAAVVRVQEMLIRMEDILEDRAPDGAITRLTGELLGDYVAATGICRAADLVIDAFRFSSDLLPEE